MKSCYVTGVSSMKGNKRSHSLHATKRFWKANLQKVTIINAKGEPERVYISARALKRGTKRGTLKRA